MPASSGRVEAKAVQVAVRLTRMREPLLRDGIDLPGQFPPLVSKIEIGGAQFRADHLVGHRFAACRFGKTCL